MCFLRQLLLAPVLDHIEEGVKLVRAQGNKTKHALPGGWEGRMRELIRSPKVVQQLQELQLPLQTCTANLAAAIAAANPAEKLLHSEPRGGPLR